MLNKKTNKVFIRGLFFSISTFCFLEFPSFAMQDDEIPPITNPVQQTIHNAMFPATSMPDNDWWRTLWPNPENVIRDLGVKKGAIAIDLCCGDGYFTFPLAEESSKVYGIELDGGLLEQAKKEGEDHHVTNCIWMQGDAMKITEMVTEPVDFILIANTFHGIPDKETLGKSMISVLKRQGELAIINWHKKPREETIVLGLPRGPKTEMRMSPTEVEDVLLPLGFVFKSLIGLPPYHYGSIFTKI
jgi:SAM-dependent methyltransferase